MSKCPFHADSVGSSGRGEIESIDCPICGSYRISKTALAGLQNGGDVPENWSNLTTKSVISTRDTRALQSA